MKGGQSVECQGQIFRNVACQLENGSVECWLKAFDSKMSSVGLNFECWCQAKFCLNIVCRMKKWANVACRNKAFMGPNNCELLKKPLGFYVGK